MTNSVFCIQKNELKYRQIHRKAQAMTDTPKRESIYQPTQEGVLFPVLPKFDNPADERLHRKQRLVGACRAFALQGDMTRPADVTALVEG